MKKRIVPSLAVLILLSQFMACGKDSTSGSSSSGGGGGGGGEDITENAQQVGDSMASVDESSGSSSGSISMFENSHDRLFKRYDRSFHLEDWLTPTKAYAATCALTSTYGSCSHSGVITRTFGGCTILGATFDGTVALTWGNHSSCRLSRTGDTITRVPNYHVTGLRGATLAVSKVGTIGQRLTWTAGSGTSKVLSFTSDGTRRAFTDASGAVFFDFTTSVGSAITVTGTTRNTSRVMSGGSLHVQNNSNGVSCDYVPSAVAWATNCNCPVSGSWAGSCSDGRAVNLVLTGCGTADFTMGSASAAVTFDRCYATM